MDAETSALGAGAVFLAVYLAACLLLWLAGRLIERLVRPNLARTLQALREREAERASERLWNEQVAHWEEVKASYMAGYCGRWGPVSMAGQEVVDLDAESVIAQAERILAASARGKGGHS